MSDICAPRPVVTPCHYTNAVWQGQYSGMIDDQHRSQFRLPYPLYERLKADAATNKRSLNAEIVDRLEKSVAAAVDPVGRIIQVLEERDARMLGEIRETVQDCLQLAQKTSSSASP